MSVVTVACVETPGQDPNEQLTRNGSPPPEEADDEADREPATAGLDILPVRPGDRRQTTRSVPHIQLDAELVPEVDAELRRRAFALPGVEERESLISLPGARSLWLADDVPLARPDVLLSGREIAHIHPDGSLHVLLPIKRAAEVDEAKWGEPHPWVDRDDFWAGMVMIYTPETLDEVEVVVRLLVDSYNFVTGLAVDPDLGTS